MIHLNQSWMRNPFQTAGHTPKMTVGNQAIKATHNPYANKDTVDISPVARALSNTVNPNSKMDKYGNVQDDSRYVIPLRGQDGRPDVLRQGKMAFIDRLTGHSTGTSYAGYMDVINSYEPRSHKEAIEDVSPFFQEALAYSPLRNTATHEREQIQNDMKKLLGKHGIKVGDNASFDFSISIDGDVQVKNAAPGTDGAAIEEILNSDKVLTRRMVKNSAMLKLQDYKYDGAGVSSAEMALLNVYLHENMGYGLDALRERGAGDIWGHDANLDTMMLNDSIFEEQVFTYLENPSSFTVEWSYGNDSIADKTNSARSFLPQQGFGTFAENIFKNPETTNDAYEFSLTPDGFFDVLDVSQPGVEFTEEEKAQRMLTMQGLLSQGAANGGLEMLKEASARAIEEHLVKHGGNKENLDVVITAKQGQWDIRVEDKSKGIKQTGI